MSQDRNQIRVLVTAAGSGASNNLIRSLRAGLDSVFIVGLNHDRFILKKSTADKLFVIAHSAGAEFADELAAIAKQEAIDVVLPTNDDDVTALSDHREKLANLVSLLPGKDLIALCQDKFVLASELGKFEVPVAKTIGVTDRQSIEEVFASRADRYWWCRPRRGCGAAAATAVGTVDTAWSWVTYWNEMRGVSVTDFTICEFLPGRDFNVLGIWLDGRQVLLKMCERLSYLGSAMSPSGTTSTPALARTIRDDNVLDICSRALPALDPSVTGVFSIDLKEDSYGNPKITEINPGRFCMITNIHDLTGEHNMASIFVNLAVGKQSPNIPTTEIAEDYYLIRELDCLPDIVHADTLFDGVYDGSS